MQRSAQMVEHVIATAVDNSRFNDRVIKSGVAHHLLSRPLRLVIWRTAVCTSAQKTHEHDFLHPCGMSRRDNILRSFDVHPVKSLLANLTINSRAMSDGIAAGERQRQSTDLREIAYNFIRRCGSC